MTLKRKLKTLHRVVSKYTSLKPKEVKVRVKIIEGNIVIHFDIKGGVWQNKTVKIPKQDIDLAIKRYRDLLRYERKLSENKENKQ
jgi:hypothetical protein